MNHDLKKWLRKEIPDAEVLKNRWDFKIWKGKRKHYKQNKPYEQKGHHALGKANHLVCERE